MVPEAPTETADATFDDDALRRFRDQLQDAFGGFLDLFLTESATRAAAVRAAVDDRDATTLGREAHSLRPTSDLLGAPALATACRDVEAACTGGWTDAAAPAAEDLLAHLDRLRLRLEPMRHDADA